ncbi:MAG: hypothetical protein IPH22_08600 [Nitrosomonas sp.]|nr:hypothetical protein [Nitrosomonas sp.]
MNNTSTLCASSTPAHCATIKRRTLIRDNNAKACTEKLAGLDYVEVDASGTSLVIHFFGTVPEGLSAQNVVIEGGSGYATSKYKPRHLFIMKTVTPVCM